MHRVRISGLAMTFAMLGLFFMFGVLFKLTAALYLLGTVNDTRIGLTDPITKLFKRPRSLVRDRSRKDALPIRG
jgi:hypothetical protein